jgi:hypothetical protein
VLPATPNVPPTLALPCILAVLDISALPVTRKATPGAVLLIPILLLTASTNKTPESNVVLAAPNVKTFDVLFVVNVTVPLVKDVLPRTVNVRFVVIAAVSITVLKVAFPIDTLLVINKVALVVTLPPLKPNVEFPLTVTELAVNIPSTVAFPDVIPPLLFAAVVTIVVEYASNKILVLSTHV